LPEVALMAASFGAFGKMPCLGDFFRLNLGHDFVTTWDAWLQEGIVALRGVMGDNWQDMYMSAPIWRFTLSPGMAGKAAMLGVVMPSVDRVGRQFPLTIAAALPEGGSALLDHFAAGPVFVQLEGIALDALDDAMTRDVLSEKLEGLEYVSKGSQSSVSIRDGVLTVTDAGAYGPLPDLAAELAGARFRVPSVWSADVTGGVRMMACEGLPDPARMQGLFDLGAPVWTQGAAQ